MDSPTSSPFLTPNKTKKFDGNIGNNNNNNNIDNKFCPFPPCSVTVLTAPTNSGKSYFLKHIFEHLDLFYPRPVSKIIIVTSHHGIPFYALSPSSPHSPLPPVKEISHEDFSEDLLEKDAILVFEDVQFLTAPIKEAISVFAHHYHLASVFVVTHELVGSPLYKLVKLAHRVVFFLLSGSICEQAEYIIKRFVRQGQDTLTHLKSIVQFVARQEEALLLEINPQKGSHQPHHIALSHLQHLTRERGSFCLLYPSLQKLGTYTGVSGPPKRKLHQRPSSGESQDKLGSWHLKPSHFPSVLADMSRTDFPHPTFVVLPSEAVVRQKPNLEEATKAQTRAEETRCADQDKWESLMTSIEESIEFFFPPQKWKICKGLAKEILSHPEFCVTADGRTIHCVGNEKLVVSLLDFIGVVARQAGPQEKMARPPEWKKYAALVKKLRGRSAPDLLFRNKALL